MHLYYLVINFNRTITCWRIIPNRWSLAHLPAGRLIHHSHTLYRYVVGQYREKISALNTVWFGLGVVGWFGRSCDGIETMTKTVCLHFEV